MNTILRAAPTRHRNATPSLKERAREPLNGDDNQLRVAAIEALIGHLVSILADAGIPYCILRNRDMIPAGLAGWKDVDMLVPASVTVRDLAQLFAPLEPANVGAMRRGHTSFYFPARDVFVRVDIYHGDLHWKQAPFVDHRGVLSRCREDGGLKVAATIDQAYIAWFSKLLAEGAFPGRYQMLVTDAVRREPVAFLTLITWAFGEELARELTGLALNGRVPESTALASACRRAVWIRALRRHPLLAPWDFARQIGHGLAQRAYPSGLDVTLLGPDGSGKTLVSTRIAEAPLRVVPYKKILIHKGYRRHLPELRRIAGAVVRRSIAPAGDARDPHGAPPHHPLVWLVKFGYYTIDSWLQQIESRRETAHTSLVLRDRHLMELTIDARRYRYEGPSLLPRMIASVQPRPAMVIVLDAPPEVLQDRKHEVPMAESIRQREAYRQLALAHPNGHIIRSDRPIDNVVCDVLDLVTADARRRTRVRYGATTAEGGPT